MRRTLVASLTPLVLVAAACGGDTETGSDEATEEDAPTVETDWEEREPESHAAPHPRLVVADADSGALHVIDVLSGETIDEVAADGAAELAVADPLGSQVLLSQRDAGVVRLLDTGIRWEAHGGHFDPANGDPALVDTTVEADAPARAVAAGDRAAVAGTGDGLAYLFDIEDAEEDEPVELDLDATVGEDGDGAEVAVPLGHDVAVGTADGVTVLSEDGAEIDTFADCSDPAGGAVADGGAALVGCAEGVLLVTADGDGYDADLLPAPDGDARVDQISATSGGHAALGSLGEDAVAVIDVDEATVEAVELPAPVATLAWDPYWEQGLVLTTDGQLHAVDPEAAEVTNSAEVTDAFDPGDGTAAIAPGESHAYVTNPLTSEVIEVAVSREGLERDRNLVLDVVPGDLVVVGMEPLEIPEGADDHDEDDDHDHDDDDHDDEDEDDHDDDDHDH